jgi:23S rRNA (pseudouridine1915-N3)-methyltransferase
MNLKIIWPGRTKNEGLRGLQAHYLDGIRKLGSCEIVETKEAKGIEEKHKGRILDIEARSLEKLFKDDYIICLSDEGKEMSSVDLARFLEKQGSIPGRSLTFVVGGFLGLAERILKRADLLLSLSKMTFSHELSRIILLEQLYRSLSLIKGRRYAK